MSPHAFGPRELDALQELASVGCGAALTALGKLFEGTDVVTASGQLDVLRYGKVFKARQLCSVRGGGAYYDGLYYVKSVTHDIKRGEYKQSFSLARGGTGSTVQTAAP